jgi:hypothetical protein
MFVKCSANPSLSVNVYSHNTHVTTCIEECSIFSDGANRDRMPSETPNFYHSIFETPRGHILTQQVALNSYTSTELEIYPSPFPLVPLHVVSLFWERDWNPCYFSGSLESLTHFLWYVDMMLRVRSFSWTMSKATTRAMSFPV